MLEVVELMSYLGIVEVGHSDVAVGRFGISGFRVVCWSDVAKVLALLDQLTNLYVE